MQGFRTALLILVMGSMPALAQQETVAPPDTKELMAPVQTVTKAINGMRAFPAAAFTQDVVVIDEFPPFVWRGKADAEKWWARLMQPLKDKKIEYETVTLDEPGKPRVKDNLVYFTVPATIDYKYEGKVYQQKGHWTFVMQKQADAWVIAAHSWDIVSDTME